MTPPSSSELSRQGADSSRSASGDLWLDDIAADSIVSREVEAMAAAWKRGERPLAEEFLARHPEFGAEETIRLVYEEACLRQEAGEESVSSEILRRFPEWRSKLVLLLDGNRLLSVSPRADFPEVGEDLSDFRILIELGRGAAGKTFLAYQRSLAHRPVVLKVTALGHEEHLSLARLQHMHIVPLYFEEVIPERGLRLMCMPHLGGTAFDPILKVLRELPADQRTGRHILEALDRLGTALPNDEPPGGPFRKYLGQATYIQAICWIGACLADALQYAHDRGLVHMDVKPSNVLLTGDGQPMLLDFHLARGPVGSDRPAPDRLGGTSHFMAPEHREAMNAIRQSRPITVRVDGRADIYSLGLLLYEALGGDVAPEGLSTQPRPPRGSSTQTWNAGDSHRDPPPARRPLKRCNARVSPGLSDILRKCLAENPSDRYRDAAALAIDLRRHLNDLPLRGVANRNPMERWRKWRRRHPAALTRGVFFCAAAGLLIAVLVVSLAQSRRRTQQFDLARGEGLENLKNQRFVDANKSLSAAARLADDFAEHDWRKEAVRRDLQRLHRASTAAELHAVVNLLRFRTGMTAPSQEEAQSLFLRGHEIWKRRGLLVQTSLGPLDIDTERQIRTDLLDLAIICADLRIHSASPVRSEESLGDALDILLDAKRQFGPSPALNRDLQSYAKSLRRNDLAPRAIPTPQTGWEHYDLGRSFLRSGEYARAEVEFHEAVKLERKEFWPHFFQGVCAYRLGQYHHAVDALSVCVGLAHDTAECYYNRGVAYEALGDVGNASDDYSQALELNPNFSDAALNRGIVSFRQKRYVEAIHDLERAFASATNTQARGRIQYNLALIHLDRKETTLARTCLKQAIDYGDEDARQLFARLGTH